MPRLPNDTLEEEEEEEAVVSAECPTGSMRMDDEIFIRFSKFGAQNSESSKVAKYF